MPKPHQRHHHVPPSVIAGFVDPGRLAAALAPWVPDARERAFVVRCICEEGPAHHRGSNWVLLALLARLLEQHPPAALGALTRRAVPMRLPPHLEAVVEDGDWPLPLATDALQALAGEGGADTVEAMVDCLTDGPPQHALANMAMVNLLTQALASPRAGGR